MAALLAGGVLSLNAQPPSVSPAPIYGKAADNKIYAQQLVNETLAAYPELGSLGLHVIPPGKKEYEIVAQQLDLIGKKSSADDLEVIERDAVKIYPWVIQGMPRFSALAALRDRSGTIIGMAAVSFKRGQPGIDKLTVHTRLVAILTELAQKIPDREALFRPVP
jgi:hypothetical protein